VTKRGHILLEAHLSGSCTEQRLVEQIAHESIGSTMQLQSSSQSVVSSQDRSTGKMRCPDIQATNINRWSAQAAPRPGRARGAAER
jgi:hypothetical protein